MSISDADKGIRALAAERRLPQAHLERWLGLDALSRNEFLNLARKLRMRTGQIVAALEMLDEIAVRERVTVAAVLEREEIHRAAGSAGSTPARAHAFVEAIRAIRFPRLKRTQQRLRAEIAALKLPRGISVVLPKELGSDELTVSIRASSGDELARLVSALE
ncbi:MAG TPA: hypothetical protein VEU51_16700, partial [Candidatus Acidoferrales bacterium]|nr:hypothetical protein [Candidatus Acidoferrales bacterium]